MKYLVIGCIFTFVFALSSAFSNAVFSISTVLCCLMIIYLKLWDKIDITELNNSISHILDIFNYSICVIGR